MIIRSLLPPTSFQSVLNGQWYIVTTDPKLGWVEVDRQYGWKELNEMWVKTEFKNTPKVIPKVSKPVKKQTFSVEGSKGKIYEIVNDGGKWSCSCPAFGFSRGNGCKHIIQIKNNQ
jgi:hypothetical protein